MMELYDVIDLYSNLGNQLKVVFGTREEFVKRFSEGTTKVQGSSMLTRGMQKLARIEEDSADPIEAEYAQINSVMTSATLNKKEFKDYMVLQYFKLINDWKKTTDSDEDFDADKYAKFGPDEILTNNSYILFEMLLMLKDVTELIEEFGIVSAITESDVAAMARKYHNQLVVQYSSYNDKLMFISSIAYSFTIGEMFIDTLRYHNISDLGFLRKDYFYLIYKQRSILLEFVHTKEDSQIKSVIDNGVKNSNITFTAKEPTVVTSKTDGTRVASAGFNATPDEGDYYYHQRIFSSSFITLDMLIDKFKSMPSQMRVLAELMPYADTSIIYAGSDMGVGKTTAMTAVMGYMPKHYTIGVLDKSAETLLAKKYPWMNVQTLLENPDRSIGDLFNWLLKTSRRAICVGEIVEPEECAYMITSGLRLRLLLSGTLHSFAPHESVNNMVNLVMRTDMYTERSSAEEDISRAIDFIFYMRIYGNRIVLDSIDEVIYRPPTKISVSRKEDSLEDVLKSTLISMQTWVKNSLDSACYEYKRIIEFEPETDRWVLVNMPSLAYMYKAKNSPRLSKENLIRLGACFSSFPAKGSPVGEVKAVE